MLFWRGKCENKKYDEKKDMLYNMQDAVETRLNKKGKSPKPSDKRKVNTIEGEKKEKKTTHPACTPIASPILT